MAYANVFKFVRRSLLMEQSEFAKKLKISHASVCNYENSKQRPRITIIKKLKELADKHHINIRLEELFDE
jgi:DNA-binding XRE family transcriptional regulator